MVHLLIPNSTNKLYYRWTGPGEILERIKPHSYKVKLSNGNVNKIRDVEFGEIHPTQVKTDFLNKSNFQADVSHLENNKQLGLFEFLHKHTSL